MGLVTLKFMECDSCDEKTQYFGSEVPIKGWARAHDRLDTAQAWICPRCVPGFKTLREAVQSTEIYVPDLEGVFTRNPYQEGGAS